MSTAVTVATPGTAVDIAVAAAQVPVIVGNTPAAAVPARAQAPAAANLPTLPNGLVIGEDDKPVFTSFWGAMRHHGAKVFGDVANWYATWLLQETARKHRWDLEDARETRATLAKEWGPLLKPNLQAIDSWLDGSPPGVDHALLNAELPGGMRLINSEVGVKFLLSLARGGPVAQQQGLSLEEEKAEIDRLMANYGSDYWKGPRSEQLQARHREFIAGTARPLTGTQLLERERAQIESLMANPYSKYWKGPDADRIQARYRELITALGRK